MGTRVGDEDEVSSFISYLVSGSCGQEPSLVG